MQVSCLCLACCSVLRSACVGSGLRALCLAWYGQRKTGLLVCLQCAGLPGSESRQV